MKFLKFPLLACTFLFIFLSARRVKYNKTCLYRIQAQTKTEYIYPLTEILTNKNITFWLDEAMIHWGDSVIGKINEGLKNAKFTLLCLSQNFLRKPWPEAEMAAVLSIQNTNGVKRVLPLILNSKEEVLHNYPLIAGLAFREYNQGLSKIATEISELTNSKKDFSDSIPITVEGVHTG